MGERVSGRLLSAPTGGSRALADARGRTHPLFRVVHPAAPVHHDVGLALGEERRAAHGAARVDLKVFKHAVEDGAVGLADRAEVEAPHLRVVGGWVGWVG